MNLFLKNSVFFGICVILMLSVGLLVPNISLNKSIDYSIIEKHKLLEETKAPKIILTGGSNVLFGYDSKLISEALNKPIVNHSIHAGYGLKYILDDLEQFVHSGDQIILSPEYSHFTEKKYLGSEPILFSLTAKPQNIKLLSVKQICNVLPFVPKFSFDRLKSFASVALRGEAKIEENVYGQYAINSFGDNNKHWNLRKVKFHPYVFNGKLNDDAFKMVMEFKRNIEKKGAILLITYPSLCKSSFDLNLETIKKIDKRLKAFNLPIIGKPKDFVYDDNLFYDSPYHLNGKGVKLRSSALVNILK